MQYTRNEVDFGRGTFRVRGDVIDVFPAEHAELAMRIELFDDEIESMQLFDPLTGRVRQKIPRFTIYPGSHYVTQRGTVVNAIESIKAELRERLDFFYKENRLVEAQRLEQRTRFDLEMMTEVGHCKGIENYTRHLSGAAARRAAGDADRLPARRRADLLRREPCADRPAERHVPRRPRAQGQNLVDYGFRLPSALDNRPLKFDEFEGKVRQGIFVSATPAEYENTHAGQVVEQLVRPDRTDRSAHRGPPRDRPRSTTCCPRSTVASRTTNACWSRR